MFSFLKVWGISLNQNFSRKHVEREYCKRSLEAKLWYIGVLSRAAIKSSISICLNDVWINIHIKRSVVLWLWHNNNSPYLLSLPTRPFKTHLNRTVNRIYSFYFVSRTFFIPTCCLTAVNYKKPSLIVLF